MPFQILCRFSKRSSNKGGTDYKKKFISDVRFKDYVPMYNSLQKKKTKTQKQKKESFNGSLHE